MGRSSRAPAPPVYPRPRGGTPRAARPLAAARGLSPPTRGNPPAATGAAGGGGSIPAHAGEPSAALYVASTRKVYPRPRGGTG